MLMNSQTHKETILNIRIITIILFLGFSITLNSCNAQSKESCDYIAVSKEFVQGLKEQSFEKLLNLVAFKSKYLPKNSSYNRITETMERSEEYVKNENLDTLRFNLQINSGEAFDYGIVSVILHKDSSKTAKLTLYFMNPKSPYPCKIGYFDLDLILKADELKFEKIKSK